MKKRKNSITNFMKEAEKIFGEKFLKEAGEITKRICGRKRKKNNDRKPKGK